MKVKVQLCINNKILAEGVKRILDESSPEITFGDHCFGPIVENPDLVLFASRADMVALRGCYPEARFIYFDLGVAESEIACLLYCHGVRGILSCEIDVGQFIKALKVVHLGEVWLEQKHLRLLLERGSRFNDSQSFRELSQQDRQIVQLVAAGETNRAIASRLCLSLPTVKAHLSRIFRCLNVENRSQLAALATKGLPSVIG